MRFVLEVGWLHVDVRVGPDDDQSGGGDSTLDALVEQSGPEPHQRSELDGRRPVGFQP